MIRDIITIDEEKCTGCGDDLLCGCPGSAAGAPSAGRAEGVSPPSRLSHWPVQMHLINPGAEYFRGADLLLAFGPCQTGGGRGGKENPGQKNRYQCGRTRPEHMNFIYFDLNYRRGEFTISSIEE